MSRQAWAYIWIVFGLGAALSIVAAPGAAMAPAEWGTFVLLTLLATAAQLFKVEAPSHQLYYITPIVLFAGMLLLPPFLFVSLVVVSHLIQWLRERWRDSSHLRNWYLQPFNIATEIIAGLTARVLHDVLSGSSVFSIDTTTPLAAFGATASYVALNHLIIGLALVLARRISWRESGVLTLDGIMPDFINVCLGFVIAILWLELPWLIILALSPLILVYQALRIPQLEHEAQTDAKTGLLNARHFNRRFAEELDRAHRLNRPLAVIMADLDLLRQINNTYGHLAGDTVLAGIGKIIRNTIRDYDIAGRFGGEEFSIVVPEADEAGARALAERIRRRIEQAEFVVADQELPIHATMSLGVACFPNHAEDQTGLIQQADIAVYQAKLRGRNQVVSASEVPQASTAGVPDVQTREVGAQPYAAGLARRAPPPVSVAGTPSAPPAIPLVKPIAGRRASDAAPVPADRLARRFWAYMVTVIALGSTITVLGGLLPPGANLLALGMLIMLVLVAELLQISVFGEGSISVTLTFLIGGVLLFGIPGAALISAATALVTQFQRRRGLSELYKVAFNWAVHMLAILPLVLGLNYAGVELTTSEIPTLLAVALPAMLGYFMIETVLISGAVVLARGGRLVDTWTSQYRWLAGHYVALGITGLFLSLAYIALDIPGMVIFALPALLLRYAQQQVVARTEASMRELRRMNQELGRANQQIADASKAIHSLNNELLYTLGDVLDARDPYVHGHAAQVAHYAAEIAAELGLAPERVELVRQAGFLHDIGKIAIADEILNKPGKLTDEEFNTIKQHPVIGAAMLQNSQHLRRLSPFVRHHHERWDGHGYPDGLAGEAIPLEARILGVCDAVEAMAADRPYRRALPLLAILGELEQHAGSQFDAQIVAAFLRIVAREGEGFIVNSASVVASRPAPALSTTRAVPSTS